MILTGLTLSNFRNIRRLKLAFKQGVTGIIGINGTGKSSIIEAIQWLLTGKLFDNASRAEALKIGEDSGYGILNFELNGKPGSIERHLDASTVILKYDGEEKKKAGEVKELWDSLLQVNTEIIERVIIAQQGHIPMLFSGDKSIREKIFQKIFLVPNTEKIRRVIFDKYIKLAPPVYVVEDADELNSKLAKLIMELELFNNNETRLKADILEREELEQLQERLRFIKKCEQDATKCSESQETLYELKRSKQEIETNIAELTELVDGLDIANYKQQLQTLEVQRTLYQNKLKLESELAGLVLPFSELEYVELIAKLALANNSLLGLTEAMGEAKGKLATTNGQLQHYSSLKGKGTCTTCGQSLKSVANLITQLEATKTGEEASVKSIYLKLNNLKQEIATLDEQIQEYNKSLKEITRIKDTLIPLKHIVFDEEVYLLIKEAINQYAKYETDLKNENKYLSDVLYSIKLEQQKLESYSVYDADGVTMGEMKEEIQKLLNQQAETTQALQSLKYAIDAKQMAIVELRNRIRVNTENIVKNNKRATYLSALNKVYDVFHSSNFPQKLIMKYAATLTEYLQENLDNFNLPYNVRLNEQFNFVLTDDNGNILPKASGGQQIQIGISLHFALHNLFSQSFPLMIIDEGTTHLDSENRAAYFAMLKQVKQKKMKQLIIIDHDPELMTVVDHVIELKKQT